MEGELASASRQRMGDVEWRYRNYMLLLKNYYSDRVNQDPNKLNDLILYMKKLNNLLYGAPCERG